MTDMTRPTLKQPGLLFMDMDSTLIQCECIDEIADFLGIKQQISEITERAMRGELDFSESLTERVQLLAGLDASVLERVYLERIKLTDGAENLITTVQNHGWKVGLVSGGFTYFTDKFKERLKLDFTRSNTLEIHNGKLTGSVLGSIVDAQTKRHCLLEQAEIHSIPISQTVALGDGANDLPMIHAAGLGIAFHAKPKVQAEAPFAINEGPLDQTLKLFSH
ncbi:phosphoserine phosphatase [Mariprofundus micogutta]|uniref:Phosphoserine phosphatase n=1 Tax=Mariprofundus micogutta TaxID=1921010 RepID=A0A1L8CL88_9PROT|nr:phosphoserine phosphatase SerB [Mariprofundus micogutta]GAV19688.1 phosphoserine phosphatase [Mariprofundus micogutta]